MKKIKIKKLSHEEFSIFGRYADLMHPNTPYIGEAPIRFFRDMLPLGTPEVLAMSVTEIAPMPLTVDVMEFHSKTGEGFLTLDGDTYICVAPATPEAEIAAEEMTAFFVPKGTAVYLHPGVWHYAPYPAGNETLHSLVLLPERTYANDCIKYQMKEAAELEC